MKTALWVCLAVVCSNAYGQEKGREAPESTLLRRATLVASCAASFWDYRTTAEGAAYGAREANGLLADGTGRPRLGLMFGVKAGICGLSALAQEGHLLGRRRDRLADPLWSVMNASLAARFAAVAIHNQAVIRGLRQQTSVPAYLAPAPAR